MSAQVKIDGLNELFAKLEKKKSAMAKIPAIVDKAADESEEKIRAYQYSQGHSQGGIANSLARTYGDGGRSVVIKSEAVNSSGKEYAQYPEFGVRGPKQPNFQEAQKAGKEVLIEEAKKLLK